MYMHSESRFDHRVRAAMPMAAGRGARGGGGGGAAAGDQPGGGGDGDSGAPSPDAWARDFMAMAPAAREQALVALALATRARDGGVGGGGGGGGGGSAAGGGRLEILLQNLQVAVLGEDDAGEDGEGLRSAYYYAAGGSGGSRSGEGRANRPRAPSTVPTVDFLDTRIMPSGICRDILWYLDLRSLARASCASGFWRRRCCKHSVDCIWQSEFTRLHASSSFMRNLEMHGKTWRGLCLLQEQSKLGWRVSEVKKREYNGHKDRVRHVRIRQDTIVSASWDRTLRMIDLAEERNLGEVGRPAFTKQIASHGGSVFGVWFDGRVAVTCSEDSTIKIWFVHKENEKRELVGHTSPVYRVAMVSKEILISCSKDFVGVWHWPSSTLSRKLYGHRHDVHRIQVSDAYIVTGSYDSTVRVWNYPSLQTAWVSERVHTGGVSCLHFEGDILATGSARGEVFIWELSSGLLLHRIGSEPHIGKTISCIMVSGKRVFSTSNLDHRFSDGVVHVWDADTGAPRGHLHEPFHINALKTDFGYIFCACSDGVLRIRDPSDDFKVLREFKHGDKALYDVDVQGPNAVTCGLDGKVVVWSISGIGTSW